MMDSKRQSPNLSEGAINNQNTVQAIGEVNSTVNVIKNNHTFNVIYRGQRIASFISEAKAIRFARQVAI